VATASARDPEQGQRIIRLEMLEYGKKKFGFYYSKRIVPSGTV